MKHFKMADLTKNAISETVRDKAKRYDCSASAFGYVCCETHAICFIRKYCKYEYKKIVLETAFFFKFFSIFLNSIQNEFASKKYVRSKNQIFSIST